MVSICACIAIISVTAITFFVFYKGLQPFIFSNPNRNYSFGKFITGLRWNPSDDTSKALYGVFYMIIGSIFATTGAIMVGVPIGVLTAVYIAELAPKRIKMIIKPSVELLAGIPSVLYGIFGLGIIVPKLMEISPQAQGQFY